MQPIEDDLRPIVYSVAIRAHRGVVDRYDLPACCTSSVAIVRHMIGSLSAASSAFKHNSVSGRTLIRTMRRQSVEVTTGAERKGFRHAANIQHCGLDAKAVRAIAHTGRQDKGQPFSEWLAVISRRQLFGDGD